jgi:glycosyltransferase involved in cell wall biosynthesis
VPAAPGEGLTVAALRVLYVHNSADLYGASRSLARLIGGLPRARYDPVVVLPRDGPLRARLVASGASVEIDPALLVVERSAWGPGGALALAARIPLSAAALRRLLIRRRIGLVHTNSAVLAAAGLAARSCRVPHVWHVRESFGEFRRLWRVYQAWMRLTSDRILAVSEAVAGQFADRRKVTVVHNGFALQEFALPREEGRAEFRHRWGLGEAFVVGCVGRIKLVRKGQEVLVEAVSRLRARGHDVRLVVVGSVYPGNEAHLAELERLVRERGLSAAVSFTGEVEDPRTAYAAFDLFVLPSVQPEPFGGVVMEAMAMSLPVVATRIGGSPEQVLDGVTGLLVEPGDAEDLAGKIERLVRDPGLMRAMAVAGRRRIAESFSFEAMLEKVTAIYDECLRDRA